jgi:hypothetical protein
VASAWERFSAADTLIYVDLPLLTHYRWVTFIKGLFASPKGWPENSPLWSSTLSTGVLDWPPLDHLWIGRNRGRNRALQRCRSMANIGA